jgi:hypothetical protein
MIVGCVIVAWCKRSFGITCSCAKLCGQAVARRTGEVNGAKAKEVRWKGEWGDFPIEH